MRSAIGRGRKFEAMPVDSRPFGQFIVDMEPHALAAAHLQHRSEIWRVDAYRCRSDPGHEFLFAGRQGQAENALALLGLACPQWWQCKRVWPS